jgi:hypothetical protein
MVIIERYIHRLACRDGTAWLRSNEISVIPHRSYDSSKWKLRGYRSSWFLSGMEVRLKSLESGIKSRGFRGNEVGLEISDLPPPEDERGRLTNQTLG